MKKIFFGILALVAMVATSCQQETDLAVNGGAATVSFQIDAPQMSRAFSDGTTATVLQYAVYEGTNELTDLTVGEDNAEVINGSTTVELQLVTGNTYTVIFWADHKDAPYTVDWATGTLTVDYSNVLSNNEKLDAFYAKHVFTVKGAQTETVYLKRPFSQVNIGTNDYAAAKSAGYEPKYSYVKVTNIYNTLNLWDGVVSNEEEVTYKYTDIPSGETFPVAGHEYLAMNYLLVAADEETINVEFGYGESNTAAEKTRTVGSVPVRRNYRTNIFGQLFTSNVDVNVIIEPTYEEPDYEADPLQIAASVGGELTLTEDVVLEQPLAITAGVILNLNGHSITAALEKSEGALITIANGVKAEINGGTIQNTTPNGCAIIDNKGELVLNGVKVVGAPIADNGYPSYALYNTGSLVVEEGTTLISDRGVISTDAGSEVVINGGHLEVTDARNNRALTSHVIYAYGTGTKLTINNGTFVSNYAPASDNGTSVICPAGAEISIYNGNFSDAGPKGQGGIFQNYMGYGVPVKVYGGVYNDNTVVKNVATGYKAIANAEGTLWTIVPAVSELEQAVLHEESGLAYNGNDARDKGVYYLTSASDLQKAAEYFVHQTQTSEANRVSFELLADVDLAGVAWEPWTVMWINFNGNNHTISNVTVADGWRSGLFGYLGASKVKDLTITNATIVGAQAGIIAAAAEGTTTTNVKIAGKNSVSYKDNGSETWGGVGALVGVLTESTINAEIVAGAVVDVNTNGIVTEAPFVDAVTGHIQPNKGTVVVNGTVNFNVDSKIVANSKGTTYVGDLFAGTSSMSDALVLQGANLTGDATIEVKRTYSAIIIENVKGDLNGDFITIDNDTNSVMVLQNCDLTLEDGKKLIKSVRNTIYQVFMANITINGEKLTQTSAAKYLENVGWYQIVDEI